VLVKVREVEEEVVVAYDKKTPAQKIRDYFNTPKWRALTKKQKEKYGKI
jgi:hypothetical protein